MKHTLRFFACSPLILFAVVSANAATVAYQNLPTGLTIPTNTSHHTVGGPVIADDFALAAGTGGQVTTVEWWGSAAGTTTWELVFQTDNAGHFPNTDVNADGGFFLAFPNAAGVIDSTTTFPGLLHYTATLSGGPTLLDGIVYWLTIANFSDNWNWGVATAGPTVGSELYNAHFSVGSTPCTNGGPHCGAWTDIHTDFALRIGTVPEPSAISLCVIGLALLALGRKHIGSQG
jgi:hypothetical protein